MSLNFYPSLIQFYPGWPYGRICLYSSSFLLGRCRNKIICNKKKSINFVESSFFETWEVQCTIKIFAYFGGSGFIDGIIGKELPWTSIDFYTSGDAFIGLFISACVLCASDLLAFPGTTGSPGFIVIFVPDISVEKKLKRKN